MNTTKYSFLLGASDQLAAEALADQLAAEGYDVMVDVAPGDQEGGWPFNVGVWFGADDPQETCELLAEAARHHSGGVYADSLEIM